jgi:hypothetical protein
VLQLLDLRLTVAGKHAGPAAHVHDRLDAGVTPLQPSMVPLLA